MGDVVKLKQKVIKHKSEKEEEILFFFQQLDWLKRLYLEGHIDKIMILASGPDAKCCTGNKISVKIGKEMCNEFVINSKDYTG